MSEVVTIIPKEAIGSKLESIPLEIVKVLVQDLLGDERLSKGQHLHGNTEPRFTRRGDGGSFTIKIVLLPIDRHRCVIDGVKVESDNAAGIKFGEPM